MSDDWPTLVLSILAALAFVVLLFSRWYISRGDRRRQLRRLLFTDALLVVAGLELVADALSGMLTGAAQDWTTLVDFGLRGALAAGGFALVVTIRWADGSFTYSELGGVGGRGGSGGEGGKGAPGKPGALGENGWGGRGGAGGAGGAGGPPGIKP